VPEGASQVIASGSSCVWADALDVATATNIKAAVMSLMGYGILHHYYQLVEVSTVI